MFIRSFALASTVLLAIPTLASAQTASFTAIFGGKSVGHLIADTKGDTTTIDFDIQNNGRGPTYAETIRSYADGLPVAWTSKGATTFGSKVDERFNQAGGRAEWTDSTCKGSAKIS